MNQKNRLRLRTASIVAGVAVGLSVFGLAGPATASTGEVARCCTIPKPPPCVVNPLMCA